MFGILFDLDGTITDSNSIHFLAWQKLLEDQKTLIDREFYEKNIAGRISLEIIPMLLPNLSEDKRMQIAEKKDLLFCQFAKENLRSTKGWEKIIEYIQRNRSRLKIGLATNATRQLTEFELDLIKIDYKTFFDAILIAEEFGVGKPNPDMYLELVRRLNLDKNRCIIFEDSISGVRAAVAAQIKCIGMLTSAKKETLEQYGTWRTINNFDEVDFDEIWNTLQEKKSFL